VTEVEAISKGGRPGGSAAQAEGPTDFTSAYLREAVAILEALDAHEIERLAEGLARVRARAGRLFILGVGGSAGHASHAVNDFRKICGMEAYTPTDNVSELTARINDEGWEGCLAAWLRGSRLGPLDGVLVLSVGGGDLLRGVSTNIVKAVEAAKDVGAFVGGIVGRDGGFTRTAADACCVIPPLVADRITPHTGGLAAVVWHLLVSHPALQLESTRWEAVDAGP
jgi:D-sedoheptulose 7-phosphate isomerase